MNVLCYECGQDLSGKDIDTCDFCGAILLLQIPGFSEQYEAIEYLHRGKQSDVFVVRKRIGGVYLLAKFYKKTAGYDNDEENMLANLDHPAIPKLVNSFKTKDTVCIVREYARGASLDRLSFSLDEKSILEICLRLCDILTYLHNLSPPVIHRDIKPQNIVLDDDNKIHLIDFGISREFSENALKDTVNTGTVGFMPPEQYGFKQTDCRADIYSLGILLCWLLTGKENPETMTSSVNGGLKEIIKKCTAFAPEQRYPDAATVKNALLQYTGHHH